MNSIHSLKRRLAWPAHVRVTYRLLFRYLYRPVFVQNTFIQTCIYCLRASTIITQVCRWEIQMYSVYLCNLSFFSILCMYVTSDAMKIKLNTVVIHYCVYFDFQCIIRYVVLILICLLEHVLANIILCTMYQVENHFPPSTQYII